jgi:hypothetical protein
LKPLFTALVFRNLVGRKFVTVIGETGTLCPESEIPIIHIPPLIAEDVVMCPIVVLEVITARR